MNEFINSIGGYFSWQFAVMSLGSLSIGLGLYIFRWYTFPIVAFGILLIYSHLNEEATKVVTQSGNSAFHIIPLFFPVVMIFILVRIKGNSSASGKEKE